VPRWYTRRLALGDAGDDVKIVQRKLSAPITGVYDEPTAARVRGVQKKMSIEQTGEVDEATAEALGEKPDAGKVPDWHGKPEQDDRVREILRLSNLEPLEDALRRFQSERGLVLSGELDEALAIAIADLGY
jgi:hypothetical protein